MALVRQKIVPCLWFDTKAEDAAKFYVGIFKNSRIGRVSRFPDAGKEISTAGRSSPSTRRSLFR